MNSSDFIALDYLLKHAKSKKAVVDSYPELKGKTVKDVIGLIAVNRMVLTGKDLHQQKCEGLRKQQYLLRRKYGK